VKGLAGGSSSGQQLVEQQQQQQQQQHRQVEPGLLSRFDYFLSHSPYNKIVRKVFARLVLHDGLRCVCLVFLGGGGWGT
jgi:3-hydroxy-3-methylglutaryl CoA synthase